MWMECPGNDLVDRRVASPISTMLIVPQDRDAITVMLTWCEAGRVSVLAKECCGRAQERSVRKAETQPCASGVLQKDLKDGLDQNLVLEGRCWLLCMFSGIVANDRYGSRFSCRA